MIAGLQLEYLFGGNQLVRVFGLASFRNAHGYVFEELDDLTHGIQRGEELMVIVARTNQGKSWVLEKMCTHVWELGFNVGYISPEMGAINIGYRFDTLHNNFSNNALVWGNKDFPEEAYKTYIDELVICPNQ